MEPIIEFNSVCKRFGSKVVLDDVSFTVPAGVVFGLLGENGAGKTTAIKAMLGLVQPNSGSAKSWASIADGRIWRYAAASVSSPSSLNFIPG